MVDPNHGLYGFFRRFEKEGIVQYDPFPVDRSSQRMGRSWTAAELRRKSFVDLHTLWYVLLRERNLCATQVEEGRRLGIMQSPQTLINAKKCRKSMARIKYVLNERRLLYEGALQIFAKEKEAARIKPKLAVEEEKEQLREKLVKMMVQDQRSEIRRRAMKERHLMVLQKMWRRVDLSRERKRLGFRGSAEATTRERKVLTRRERRLKNEKGDLATTSLQEP